MTLGLDDLPRDPDWLLQQLRHMAEVVAAERSRISTLDVERATVLAERDAVCAERDVARAEIEKLRLLIRQLQRGQQLWSMLVYGSGGSLLLGSLNGFAVAEAHAIDHLSEALRAVQPTPVPLGRLGKLEDHCKGGLA